MAKEIPLTRGYVTVVDDEDYEWLSQWKWYAHTPTKRCPNKVYAAGRSTETFRYMHRLILGVTDRRSQVDHRDLDSLNNQRINLRLATQGQNNRNVASRKSVHTSVDYKGVYPGLAGVYLASINARGKKYHLGTYATAELAARSYDEVARCIFGPFARLNFPGVHLG